MINVSNTFAMIDWPLRLIQYNAKVMSKGLAKIIVYS